MALDKLHENTTTASRSLHILFLFLSRLSTHKKGAFHILNTKQASLGDRRQAMHTGVIVSNTLIILVGES